MLIGGERWTTKRIVANTSGTASRKTACQSFSFHFLLTASTKAAKAVGFIASQKAKDKTPTEMLTSALE